MYRTGSGSALLCLAQSLAATHGTSWNRNNINNNNIHHNQKAKKFGNKILLKTRYETFIYIGKLYLPRNASWKLAEVFNLIPSCLNFSGN